MFSISSLAVTALNPWENDGYWLCFTAAFEMAVKPLFSKTFLLIPPSAWWYCCCDGFRLGVRWGGTCVRLAVWAGENGASIGHRSPEVGLSNRPQAEHSWTLHGHSEFTLPLLICYTKALAACRGGHMQQAAEGEIVLPFGGVGGCCQDWTQRLGLKDVCHRASKAAEFVILHIWRWSFWFQAAGLHWLESVLKKVEFSGFPKEANFPFAIWNIDANAL